MKSVVLASFLVLFLLSSATTRPTAAQTGGGAASGSYKFILEDGLTRYVEFAARSDDKGTAIGEMTFTDETKVSELDPDDIGYEERSVDSPPDFYIKAEFDAMTVEKNRAVMSGTIRDSSYKGYIGKWVQLVVEDNGDSLRVPDQLTWGVCLPPAGSWIPTDAELKYDDGAFMRWWATDAERKDDVGIPSKNLISGDEKGCHVHPLSFYSFAELQKWEGDIRVTE